MVTEISSHIHWPVVEKLKYCAADGEAVHEGDAAAGGMALVFERAGFKQRGAEQADFGDFAADAVDLDPVAHVDAILADEHEPAEKGEDEILQGDGERSGSEAKDSGRLLRRAEDDKQDENARPLPAHRAAECCAGSATGGDRARRCSIKLADESIGEQHADKDEEE